MTYFLERIAAHIYDRYGDSLEKQCLVFPNRRASLYFLKYLSAKTSKPVWAPAVKTINELFSSFSTLQIAENEQLIFELYLIYRKLNPKAESFDDFYFWGEMLLNDFDDVDKYLADAQGLFTTVGDIKKIDSEFGNLTPDQVKAVRQFWINFDPLSATKQKSEFLDIWSILPQFYLGFRDTLINKGLAYEGIVYRNLAESCMKGHMPEFKWENFHLIGFNALNSCERILMKTLKKYNKARFYWDYDNSFIQEGSVHSAGFFIKHNLADFGNDMPDDWDYDTFASGSSAYVRRRIIETSSDVAQVKLVPDILKDTPEVAGPEAHHTAIVLSDENLLIPLISTIPDFIPDVNITMGYPVKFSPVYSLIRNLINLQKNAKITGQTLLFDHLDVINLLKHNYISDKKDIKSNDIITNLILENKLWVSADYLNGFEGYANLFRKTDTPESFNSYLINILQNLFIIEGSDDASKEKLFEINIRNEFIYRTLLAINRLSSIIDRSGIQMRTFTYLRLIDKVIRSLSVPFSGEPLNGVQIMGILETRTLDFKNLIILSVNEGIMPKSTTSSSFIPYSLREAFGLPTIRHQDSIYAYYFYRLLERSENVTFIYNSNSEGLRTGEMSRFLLQLKYLNEKPPEFTSIGFKFSAPQRISNILQRSERINEQLKKTYIYPGRKALSPSAVNTWLNCRMRFYYRYICGLKEPEIISTEIDPALFGELLHKIMNKLYSPFIGRLINQESIRFLRKDKSSIESIIHETINSKYAGGKESFLDNDQIISSILYSYVDLVLRYDATIGNITILSLEKEIYSTLSIRCNNEVVDINAGGIMDRLDSINGTLRIIDYKTGNVIGEIDSVGSLFDPENKKRNDAWFQLLMYCEIYALNNKGKVCPSLYSIRKISDPDYTDKLKIKADKTSESVLTDYSLIRKEFVSGLEKTISSIFDKDQPFTMTEQKRLCESCLYRQLCQR